MTFLYLLEQKKEWLSGARIYRFLSFSTFGREMNSLAKDCTETTLSDLTNRKARFRIDLLYHDDTKVAKMYRIY